MRDHSSIRLDCWASFALSCSKSLDWYEKHFAHCKIDQKIGEFSASYIYDADAAKKIKALYPDIKIIVCLRNPVDRTYSQYLMFRDYLKKEERPFEEAIQNEPELLARSKYAEFLKAYLELFPRQNFLFLTLDEIVNEAQSTLKRVFQFLEVDASFVPADFMTNRKKASASRSPLVSKTMGLFTKTMTGLGLSGVVLKLKEMGLKDTVLKMNSKNIIKEKLNPALRNELKKQFAEDIVRTAELTGLDLSKWK